MILILGKADPPIVIILCDYAASQADGVTLNPESELVPVSLLVGETRLAPLPSTLVVGF